LAHGVGPADLGGRVFVIGKPVEPRLDLGPLAGFQSTAAVDGIFAPGHQEGQRALPSFILSIRGPWPL
jgi:hypothetical protein